LPDEPGSTTSRVPAATPRSPLRAYLISLGLHAGALGAAIALLAAHRSPIQPSDAAAPAPVIDLAAVATEVDVIPTVAPAVVRAAAGAASGDPADTAAPAIAGSGAPGHVIRRGHPHSLSYAPLEANPYADLQVSYDAPGGAAAGAGDAEAGLGAALHGTGLGAGGTSDGTGGGLDTPAPPASHRKPVEPRRYYTSWKFHDVRMLVGETIQAELIIDPRGLVHDVRITRHVNPWVDQQATRLAHRFLFFPSLNDAGEPIWGSFPWTFRITG
jgi:hypothetical protein